MPTTPFPCPPSFRSSTFGNAGRRRGIGRSRQVDIPNRRAGDQRTGAVHLTDRIGLKVSDRNRHLLAAVDAGLDVDRRATLEQVGAVEGRSLGNVADLRYQRGDLGLERGAILGSSEERRVGKE